MTSAGDISSSRLRFQTCRQPVPQDRTCTSRPAKAGPSGGEVSYLAMRGANATSGQGGGRVDAWRAGHVVDDPPQVAAVIQGRRDRPSCPQRFSKHDPFQWCAQEPASRGSCIQGSGLGLDLAAGPERQDVADALGGRRCHADRGCRDRDDGRDDQELGCEEAAGVLAGLLHAQRVAPAGNVWNTNRTEPATRTTPRGTIHPIG